MQKLLCILVGFLKEEGITEIEVIGVDGGGCVSLTALGAIDNGYRKASS